MASTALCAWAILFYRLTQGLRRSPALSKSIRAAGSVCAVVPLRNESQNVDSLVSNLLSVKCVDKVVLVDDCSTDDTGVKVKNWADSSKVVAVSLNIVPRGWGGKSYACYVGASLCEAAWLLFLDADTRLSEDAVQAALGLAENTGSEAVSVAPTLICRSIWDKVATPFYTFLLNSFIRMDHVNDAAKRTAYFYGSFILFKSRAYWRIGGHAPVASDLVEDRALGSYSKANGVRITLAKSGGMVHAAWAPGFRNSFNALTRVTIPSIRGRVGYGAAFVFAVTMLFIVPYLGVASTNLLLGPPSLLTPPLSEVSLLLALLGTIYCDLANEVTPAYSLGFPVAQFVYVAALWTSVAKANSGKPFKWRGRLHSYKGTLLSSEPS